MGRIAEVRSYDSEESTVKVDMGGDDLVSADHFQPAGVDAVPLPGDSAAVEESTGAGNAKAAGYSDPTARVATAGEIRIYSRNSEGEVVATVHIRSGGAIEITSGQGADIVLNGVTIDNDGNVSAPGEVTAQDGSPTTAVGLSTHLHGSPMGPTQPPTGGT